MSERSKADGEPHQKPQRGTSGSWRVSPACPSEVRQLTNIAFSGWISTSSGVQRVAVHNALPSLTSRSHWRKRAPRGLPHARAWWSYHELLLAFLGAPYHHRPRQP